MESDCSSKPKTRKTRIIDCLLLGSAVLVVIGAFTFHAKLEACLFSEAMSRVAESWFEMDLQPHAFGLSPDDTIPPEGLRDIYAACRRGKEQADLLRPHAPEPYVKVLNVMVTGCAALGVRQGTPPVRAKDVRAVLDAVVEASTAAEDALQGAKNREEKKERDAEIAKAPERVRSMASWK